ncbi:MAG: pterin dehydratase [Dactylosporangium sp.]|nr:4a-hydroxytetrahydrobiopterin dehydratase [Dactylosporangium sp.]NNJ63829.1 pterin dehydratase [Dactylosporangium sp.]
MGARRGEDQRNYLSDALALLQGWTRDGRQIQRVLHIDDCQHAALTERMKIVSDALQLRPEIRRSEGCTQIRVRGTTPGLSANEVALAARIEDLYSKITDVPR